MATQKKLQKERKKKKNAEHNLQSV